MKREKSAKRIMAEIRQSLPPGRSNAKGKGEAKATQMKMLRGLGGKAEAQKGAAQKERNHLSIVRCLKDLRGA